MPDQVRLGAICWILTAQFFLAQIVAQAAFPAYDLALYDISLLGVTACGVFTGPASGFEGELCSPLHGVFNAGIIVHGVLVLIGVWLTRHLWPSDGLTVAALLCLGLGGFGAMLVGFFPLDTDMGMHVVGAVLALGLPGVGFLILGQTLYARHPELAWWTTITGTLIVLGGVSHAFGGGPFGRGLVERLAAWPQTIWYVGVGTSLLFGQVRTQSTVAPRLTR